MKTIGLIGGMSWESTIEYYRIINQEVNTRLGGVASAKILMESYDFSEIAPLQHAGKWDEIAEVVLQSANTLAAAGADFIAITTNTVHKIVPEIEKNVVVPIFHIAEATALEALKQGFSSVALLGTKYTMSENFYTDILTRHGIGTVLPDVAGQNEVHRIIFDELCCGVLKESSAAALGKIIDDCAKKGAQAVVLGCTELPNIIKSASLPLLNTAEIHSKGIVDYALGAQLSAPQMPKAVQ